MFRRCKSSPATRLRTTFDVEVYLERRSADTPRAARLGHKDAGYLLVTTYADTRRESLRQELAVIDAEGGIDARRAARGIS